MSQGPLPYCGELFGPAILYDRKMKRWMMLDSVGLMTCKVSMAIKRIRGIVHVCLVAKRLARRIKEEPVLCLVGVFAWLSEALECVLGGSSLA